VERNIARGSGFGQDGHELARQFGHVAREKAAEEVHDPPARRAHRIEDGLVPVAQRRAHLPGGEVEDPPPILGGQPAAGRALDEQVRELAAVADQVLASVGAGGVGGGGRPRAGPRGAGVRGAVGRALRVLQGRALLAALEAGDGEEAARLMAGAIRAFRDELLDALRAAVVDAPLP
jgi:hypothetical protein